MPKLVLPEPKTLIEQRARALGFDGCHFTTAATPSSGGHFEEWLAGGLHGEMGYLQRNSQRRLNPQQVLPGARSIIVLAASYAPASSTPQIRAVETVPSGRSDEITIADPRAATGVVARYARFNDYHAVLGERLKSLAEFTASLSEPASRSLWYVDTGPLLERDLAQRAGAGFIGKHTNLISRKLGNWIFLAEILTTLELPPDVPERNRCGTCVRCLEACPTQAITSAFRLDARRCISYLTIELKGAIPIELRPAIGNRIYGCDDCLAVCPWNRFAAEGRLMKEQARPDLAQPNLLELLSLDEVGFQNRFAGTPMLRTKRRGLLRNVCVALGNSGDERALPALEQAATDPEALIAEHARWAIEEIARKGKVVSSPPTETIRPDGRPAED